MQPAERDPGLPAAAPNEVGEGGPSARTRTDCQTELNAGGGLFKPVGMDPKQVEDAAPEFNSRVQIVSPPPDQFRFRMGVFWGSTGSPDHGGSHICREVIPNGGVMSARTE